MKREKIIIHSFCVLICFFTVMLIGALMSDKDISQVENRALSEKPTFNIETYLSGTYFKQWESFISDHVPFRYELITKTEKIQSILKINKNTALVEVNADMGGQNSEETPEVKQDLLAVNDRLLEVYSYNSETCDYYSQAANNLMNKVPQNVNKYLMIVPTAIEFEEEKYKNISDSQLAAIDYVYGKINPDVKSISTYEVLSKHSDEYIYFRTDHHWTTLGAYYGAKMLLECMDTPIYKLDKYSQGRVENYLGYLYNMAPSENLKNNPDYIDYYMLDGKNNHTEVFYYDDNKTLKKYRGKVFEFNYFKSEASYGLFLGGDYPMIVVDGDADNGKVLAIVKDSYGNAFIPWLTPYFENVIAIDPRAFEGDISDVIQEYEVTDFLLLDYTKATMLSGYVDYINNLAE